MRRKIGEVLPTNETKLLGKHAVLISYHDVNLCHSMISGRCVSGALCFVGANPVECHPKKKASVETDACRPEYSSARTCVEQILDTRINLRCLEKKIHKLGNNESAVDSSVNPHRKIHKRDSASSFHRVRETISVGIISCCFIDSSLSPIYMLNKH